MQIIDTFSGIGGFSLAGSWLGWRTVQFCEMNDFCNKVLRYYWPNVPIHTDIETLTAEQIINNGLYDRNETTILTGGVPCQPWSHAGKRKGEDDDRNLWPQTIKLIGSLQPDYALLENVPGFLTWNKGVFLEQMLSSLENEGYEVQPVILPACAVNAPHRRDRIWIIANRSVRRLQRVRNNGLCESPAQSELKRSRSKWITPNTASRRQSSEKYREAESRQSAKEGLSDYWENFPTQSPLCSRNDGISSQLSGITFSKHRNESIKAYGNAIVPQIAFEIFKAIEQFELSDKKI